MIVVMFMILIKTWIDNYYCIPVFIAFSKGKSFNFEFYTLEHKQGKL